jgi:2-oxoglutarate ferredoxin oxidoreductase subunit beta
MATAKDFSNDIRPTWCPGCGNHGIWNALKRALPKANLEPHEVIVVTGIGCGSKIADYMHVNGLQGLHGRTLAMATGVKLANHGLKVVCVHGDGDGYGMGANHMLHAARRNIGFVDVVQNNHVYGLTKGQYSPTSKLGFVTPTSPEGALDRALNPLALALSQGATFVARGFAADVNHLTDLIATAIGHRGYALIDVLQPCVTYNKGMDYDYWRERVYKVEDEGYDPADREAAMRKAWEYPSNSGESTGRVPLGIIYRDESVPSYEEQVSTLEAGPLALQPMHTRPAADYRRLIDELY